MSNFKKLMRDSLARRARYLYPDGSPPRSQRAAFVRHVKAQQPECYSYTLTHKDKINPQNKYELWIDGEKRATRNYRYQVEDIAQRLDCGWRVDTHKAYFKDWRARIGTPYPIVNIVERDNG